MKNIHILPTDKPSRLFKHNDTFFLNEQFDESSPKIIAQNIYITSDEEIKPNVYALINKVLSKTELLEGKIVSRQLSGGGTMDICKTEYLEIILTTDQDLIKDGVQAIDDEFLRWFVNNPSCESVEVIKGIAYRLDEFYDSYEIIIPKEEPKLTNVCIKCGVDLHYAPNFTCQEHPKNCKGIHLSEETLKEMALKEEPKPIHEQIIDLCGGEEQFKEIAGLKPIQEIKPEDVFNDEKRQAVATVIKQHKALKSLSLVNPLHLEMTSDGHGEFPNGYKLTEKGIQYIIEQLNTQ